MSDTLSSRWNVDAWKSPVVKPIGERKVWNHNREEFRSSKDVGDMSTADRVDTIKGHLKVDYKEQLKELREAWERERCWVSFTCRKMGFLPPLLSGAKVSGTLYNPIRTGGCHLYPSFIPQFSPFSYSE